MSITPSEYKKHILSPEWKATRNVVLANAGHACEMCGAPGDLDVHHLTYKNFGHEHHAELVALCKVCHREADAFRRDAKRDGLECVARYIYVIDRPTGFNDAFSSVPAEIVENDTDYFIAYSLALDICSTDDINASLGFWHYWFFDIVTGQTCYLFTKRDWVWAIVVSERPLRHFQALTATYQQSHWRGWVAI